MHRRPPRTPWRCPRVSTRFRVRGARPLGQHQSVADGRGLVPHPRHGAGEHAGRERPTTRTRRSSSRSLTGAHVRLLDSTTWCSPTAAPRAATTAAALPAANLADGTHTFRVRARDGGEFDRVPAVFTWVVDTVAPTVAFGASGPGEGALQAVNRETFVFSSSEDSTFECQLDGAGFAPCASGITLEDLSASRAPLRGPRDRRRRQRRRRRRAQLGRLRVPEARRHPDAAGRRRTSSRSWSRSPSSPRPRRRRRGSRPFRSRTCRSTPPSRSRARARAARRA